MPYMHIDNLYKDQTILMFKECYAMEKIHGTSAHISFKPPRPLPADERVVAPADVTFFSGGSSHLEFVKLFNKERLLNKLSGINYPTTIYGEAFGGKQQGMRLTYGDKLQFAAFEVKIGESWLDVPKANDFVAGLELPFVYWKKIPTDLAIIDEQRDAPSEMAIRLGLKDNVDKFGYTPPIREGIVLRPPFEVTMNNGKRVIAKHKRDDFKETKTPRKVGEEAPLLATARAVADEWVTEERLNHILDAMGITFDNGEMVIQRTGDVIKTMVEDVFREAGIEIEGKKYADKEIGRATALMYKRRLANQLR